MNPARVTSTSSSREPVSDQDGLTSLGLSAGRADSLQPTEAGPHFTVAITRYQDPFFFVEEVEVRFSAEDFSPRWWPGQDPNEV